MNEELNKACESLDAFATQVTNTWGNDSTMTDAVGWHSPALTRHDLAALPRLLARDLRNAGPESLDESLLPLVRDIPRRLQLLQGNTLPQMFGGNSPQAVPAYSKHVRGSANNPLVIAGLASSKRPESNASRACSTGTLNMRRA